MTDVSNNIQQPTPPNDNKIFSNIKYKIIGKVPDDIVNLLKLGGGEGSAYFSDYLTHCIVGEDATDTDVGDAKDLYEIPAIYPEWVSLSKKCGKMLPTKPFMAGEELLFTGLVACLSQVSKDDCDRLWAMIKFHGGTCSFKLNSSTTHLVVGKAEGVKYDHVMQLEKTDIQIVTPDWIVESIRQKSRLQENLYHPRLLLQPPTDKKISDLTSTFSTAHITGFADEDITPKENTTVPKLTNELLEQLKQRMPWNQPQSTSTTVASSNQLPITTTTNSTIGLQENKEENKAPVTSTLILQQSQVTQNLNQLQNKPHQTIPIIQQATQQNSQIILQQQQQQRLQPPLQGVAQTPWRTQTPLQQQQQQPPPQQLVHQPLQIHQQQQPVIQQSNTMLLSPQNQNETQQFIVNQTQLAQVRPQQVLHQQPKPVIQQQFVVREGPPHLVQPQYAEAKPTQGGQFTWQQQYTQNRQVLATPQPATPQQAQQLQQRQVTWSPQGQLTPAPRQLIHMDLQTHNQLQQMDPQQRAIFLQKVQTQRQFVLQRQLRQNQTVVQGVDQGQVQFGVVRTGQPQPQPQTAVIRGQIPPGLNSQHQLQWLQQQHRNQIVLQQNRQQVLVQQQQQVGAPAGLIRAPVPPQAVQHQRLPVSVVSQTGGQVTQQGWQQDTASIPAVAQNAVQTNQQSAATLRHQQQQQQQQLQLQRLQQIQLQKQQQQQQQQQQQPPGGPQRLTHYATQNSISTNANQQSILLSQHQSDQPDPSVGPDMLFVTGGQAPTPQGLVVNAKTKTALANMLSNRLQGGVSQVVAAGDGTASGQLRMMTAQHQAPLPPPPPPQPAPFQRTTLANVNNTSALVRVSEGIAGNSPGVGMKPASYAQTAARVAAVLAKSASGTPPASHHHRPQFYGHNPNFKLPPEMFLLGCVFLIMEYDRSGFDVTMWRRIILENGGETELTYSLKVTHILCQTQKHPLVQQGLRDGKRCVTAEWLSDVMIKQQVIPPWVALHFPTPFSDEKPCRNLIISHSGFEGEERVRVKKMIEAVGAKMTSYYTSHNNILVCRKPEGEKYKKAREWGKSVVNVQWLNEVLFGHYSCLQHPENQKYQQFNIANPFRIDYTLIPHLMGAWKVPIQVTQECYERAKSSGIVGPKRKRQRVASPTNSNSAEQENALRIENSLLPPQVPLSRPVIMFSGATNSDDEKKILHLGGVLARNCREATHLIMYKVQRTLKLMCCLSISKYIVTSKWIVDSFVSNRFLDEQPYIVDDVEFEKKHSCNILKVLSNSDRTKLFIGKIFYITPGVIPARSALTEMIQCAGGLVEKQRRSLKHIQELEPNTYFVVTVFNDFHLVSDLIRANIGLFSAEFVMTSILTQKIAYDSAFKKNSSKTKV